MAEAAPEIVLASGSSARRELLERAGIRFSVQPAAVDEDAVRQAMSASGQPEPRAVAEALAAAKAVAVSRLRPGAVVVGADQVLDLGGEIVNKSPDLATAKALLARMSGRTHALHSALAIARSGVVVWGTCEIARLTMRRLSDTAIDDYLASVGPGVLASVGAYQIEGRGITLFERIEGDHFTILGLPLLPLIAALREQGALDR